jgi:hypothetical protein
MSRLYVEVLLTLEVLFLELFRRQFDRSRADDRHNLNAESSSFLFSFNFISRDVLFDITLFFFMLPVK